MKIFPVVVVGWMFFLILADVQLRTRVSTLEKRVEVLEAAETQVVTHTGDGNAPMKPGMKRCIRYARGSNELTWTWPAEANGTCRDRVRYEEQP